MESILQKILVRVVGIVGMLFVFCMHVYLGVILGAKPALAAETAAAVAIHQVETSSDQKGKVASKNPEAQVDDAEVSVSETTLGDEEGVSIKINGKDGISITGSQKLVDKLQSLEQKIEERLEQTEAYQRPDTVVYKTLENVLVPIVFFLVVFGFAGYVIYSKHKTRRELLETIRMMAQNGQTIPPEMLGQLHNTPSQWNINSVNYSNPSAAQGLKYIFIGIGVVGFLVLMDVGFTGSALGFIFLVMGSYYLTKSHLLQKQMEQQKNKEASTGKEPSSSASTAPSETTSSTSQPQL